jgi:hypothetical protein
MLFGRVEAVAETAMDASGIDNVKVTVYLETNRRIEIIREEVLPVLRSIVDIEDVAWHADQYAQETIANELSAQGWEVIAGGDIPEPELGAMARSASYVLRRVSDASFE